MKLKHLISAAALALSALFAPSAFAVTYYVSDCDTLAHVDCEPGDNTNNGTSASTPWRNNASNFLRNRIREMQPNDQMLFAKGGHWADDNAAIAGFRVDACVSTMACVTSPVIFDSYTPSWGGSAKPLFTESRGPEADWLDAIFSFTEGGGLNTPDGGYVLRNLELRKLLIHGWFAGIKLQNSVHNVRMENLTISGFYQGVNAWGGNTDDNDWKPWNIVLVNSDIHDNPGLGVLWGASDSYVAYNTFTNNGTYSAAYPGGTGNVTEHNVYLAGYDVERVYFHKNTFRENTRNEDGDCTSVDFVAHGSFRGLYITENDFYAGEPGVANDACWAIAVDGGYGLSETEGPESFTDVLIARNLVRGYTNTGIGCHACVSPTIVANKIIVPTGTAIYGVRGIAVPDRGNSGDGADSGATIAYNSIYYQTPLSEDYGIVLGESQTAGTNLRVFSNLIVYGAANSTYARCFMFYNGVNSSNFTLFEKNHCYAPGANMRFSDDYVTQANAAAAGLNIGGLPLTTNPVMTVPTEGNSWSMVLDSASPVRNAGSTHANAAILRHKVDFKRCLLDADPDIGADQYFVSTCTATPPAPYVRRKTN